MDTCQVKIVLIVVNFLLSLCGKAFNVVRLVMQLYTGKHKRNSLSVVEDQRMIRQVYLV